MIISLLALLASAAPPHAPTPTLSPGPQDPPAEGSAAEEPVAAEPVETPGGPPSSGYFYEAGAADGPLIITQDALAGALARLAETHDVAELQVVGTSRAGVRIEALRLAGPASEDGADGARPAILLVAGVDGPRVFESGMALDHARRLAMGYGNDERITALLDSTTVYVVPRVAPDAAAWRLGPVRWERAGTGHDTDEDRDGRRGEDPPQDVDGDGLVTWMRVEDPEGTWIADPADERVLIEADPLDGQRGRWLLYREGRDLDGDELVAEDTNGEAEVNRNFASGWEEHTARAGLFPTDEPEVRALCEFVMLRSDIALVLTYGELDNLVAKPKTVADDARATNRVPAPGILQSDWDHLAVVAEGYREATERETEGGTDDLGTFQRWAYDHRGLWSLAASPWHLPQGVPEEASADENSSGEASADENSSGEASADENSSGEASADETSSPNGAGAPVDDIEEPVAEAAEAEVEDAPEPSDDAKHLEWIDATGETDRFVPWRTIDHPELGPVDVGGFAPWARIEPPSGEQIALAHAHFEWFLGLGAQLPRIEVASFTAESLGTGLVRLEAALENNAFLPLSSESARRTRTVRPARVRLVLPEGSEVLAGERQVLVRELAGSGGRRELVWLVRGAEAAQIFVEVDTDNAGTARKQAEVAQ